jgi:hypothetical protein
MLSPKVRRGAVYQNATPKEGEVGEESTRSSRFVEAFRLGQSTEPIPISSNHLYPEVREVREVRPRTRVCHPLESGSTHPPEKKRPDDTDIQDTECLMNGGWGLKARGWGLRVWELGVSRTGRTPYTVATESEHRTAPAMKRSRPELLEKMQLLHIYPSTQGVKLQLLHSTCT